MVNLVPPRFIDPASADATNDTLRYNPSSDRVEFMPGGGGGGVISGAVDRYVKSTDTTINSTANADVAELAGGLTSTSTADVFLVDVILDLDCNSTATFIAELLIDGVVETTQLVARTGTDRLPAGQKYKVTGLSAGTHPFKVRARLSAASGSYIVRPTHSTVMVTRFGDAAAGAAGAVDGGAPDSTYFDFIDGGTP